MDTGLLPSLLPKYAEIARYGSFARELKLDLDTFEGKGLPAVDDASLDDLPPEVCNI